MGYIKGNFFQGLSFNNTQDLNVQARAWLDQVANVRVHGTTQEVPLVRWRETERHALRTMTAPPYDTSIVGRRKVSRDGYVVVRTNRYSVPWNFAGQWVVTRETPNGRLEVLDGDKVVAVHPLLPEGIRFQPVRLAQHHEVPADQSNDVVRTLPAPDVKQRPLAVYELLANERSTS